MDGARAVSRRVDVDEKAPPVAIPGRILDELCQHAWDTLPEECCGLVLGDEEDRYQRVVRCHNDMNQRHTDDPERFPRDAKTAFWMRETDYQAAWQQAQKAGLEVTAVYHSHVGVAAYLSDEDLAYAERDTFPFPEADQIVLGVPVVEPPAEQAMRLTEKDLKPSLGIFRRPAPGAAFHGHGARQGGA